VPGPCGLHSVHISMIVPEEFRCCVCLSTPERALLTGCPHRVCTNCAEVGKLETCPVCRAPLPDDRPHDEAFALHVAVSMVDCPCGAQVSVLHAEGHVCQHTRKRKIPDGLSMVIPGGRKPPPPAPNRSTFACPLCEERNLTAQGLLEHCEKEHNCEGRMSATCPICSSMPWGDPTYVSRDFLAHLRLRHRCDYTVLADFEADEESMFRRALAESIKSAGIEAEIEEEERVLAQVLQQSAEEASRASASEADDGSSASGGGSSASTELAHSSSEGQTEDQNPTEEDDDEPIVDAVAQQQAQEA